MKAGTVLCTVFYLKWSNPYTSPPSGKPRCIVRVVRKGHCPNPVPEFIYRHTTPGDGYTVAIHIEKVPGKKWSEGRKHKYRKKMLWNRVQKKYPMFADEIYQQELEKKPEYYGLGEEGE